MWSGTADLLQIFTSDISFTYGALDLFQKSSAYIGPVDFHYKKDREKLCLLQGNYLKLRFEFKVIPLSGRLEESFTLLNPYFFKPFFLLISTLF